MEMEGKKNNGSDGVGRLWIYNILNVSIDGNLQDEEITHMGANGVLSSAVSLPNHTSTFVCVEVYGRVNPVGSSPARQFT